MTNMDDVTGAKTDVEVSFEMEDRWTWICGDEGVDNFRLLSTGSIVQVTQQAMAEQDEFPCSLTIDIPFPTHRLASAAIRTLSVDQELSPLVRRHFTLECPSDAAQDEQNATILRTFYRATTNRMLRVSVNGFFESMTVVLQVIQELDVDVIEEEGLEGLEGAQGVEVGMTGTTKTGG